LTILSGGPVGANNYHTVHLNTDSYSKFTHEPTSIQTIHLICTVYMQFDNKVGYPEQVNKISEGL
jgi:hypothetical protein